MTIGSTPTAHYSNGHVTLYHGDCRDILAQLPDDSVDSIVTDPPYGIEFMGKQWDAFAPEVAPSTAARIGSKLQRNDGGMNEKSITGGTTPVFGGNRSRTHTCTACGKRDQFRNPHACDSTPGARWESIVMNEHGAPAAAIGFQQWCEQWARECLRVLKPGGHLLAFGGTRTYHRLACAIEDAGFDIRDSIHWVYGSGFPKSLNVSKQIDKQAGAVREVVGTVRTNVGMVGGNYANGGADGEVSVTAPATDDAQTWAGWGTALKPAHEPIVLARKPPRDTIANNVLRYGTGALNIDATRVPHDATVDLDRQQRQQHADGAVAFGAAGLIGTEIPTYKPGGRWPANLIHDGSSEVLEHFPNTASTGNGTRTGHRVGGGDGKSVGIAGTKYAADGYNDGGSAGRFFNTTPYTDLDGASFVYCSKAGTAERNAGLDEIDNHERPGVLKFRIEGSLGGQPITAPRKNHHPTVKPLALMRHLIRLVTPPGGTVLEPFAGSGTTLAAATLEGFDAIGIELTADYLPIITGRIQWATEQHANEHPTLF